jgi:putative redox protein
MKLTLQRIEEPFVMELTNEQSNLCLMDAAPSLGGQDKGFRPMELLAGSLAGCISVDVLNVLRKQRIALKHYKIIIEAKRKDAVPSPFEHIHMIFEFDDSVEEKNAKRIIDLAKDKYCSVSASLSAEIEITYEVRII